MTDANSREFLRICRGLTAEDGNLFALNDALREAKAVPDAASMVPGLVERGWLALEGEGRARLTPDGARACTKRKRLNFGT